MDEKPIFVRPTIRRALGAVICLGIADTIVLCAVEEPTRQSGCIIVIGWPTVALPIVPILVGLASGILLEGSRVNDWIEKASRPFLLVFLIWMLSLTLRLH